MWIGSEEGGSKLVTSSAPQVISIEPSAADDTQLRAKFGIAFEPGVEMSVHASEVGGRTYYNVTLEPNSYFKAFPNAKRKPDYLLFRVEFVNDDEVVVWTSYVTERAFSSGLTAEFVDEYWLVRASPDQLRAALLESPLRVLNVRLGPYFRLRPSPVQAQVWSFDERSGCAVGLREPYKLTGIQSVISRLTWSGDCVEGKASGQGLLELTAPFIFGDLHIFCTGTMIGGVAHGLPDEWECKEKDPDDQ